MKFALVGYGVRGDVEPLVALGRELLRRGHEVRTAVAPNMVCFVESAGLASVVYGLDATTYGLDFHDLVGMDFSDHAQNAISRLTLIIERFSQVWAEKSATLTALANGADVLVASFNEQRLAANVAESHDIPLVVLHYNPAVPNLLGRQGQLSARVTKEAGDAQRRALGLPEARPSADRASPEIHAYDGFCFPALQAECAKQDVRRSFVGALTLELSTDADDDALSWIAEESPPIFFGFGSTRVLAETVAMISAACAQLGERALVCAGGSDFTHANPQSDHVKIVGALNYAAIFPACQAVVHHGGTGTTAASLRAGIPTLILPATPDQAIWAYVVIHLEVGCGRPFVKVTQKSLVADLRSILTPHCAARAREVATQMSKPAESAARAADLLEEIARFGRPNGSTLGQ